MPSPANSSSAATSPNLVPRSDSPISDASVAAALEYAVLELAVGHIVVLGHAGCGGCRGLCPACQNHSRRRITPGAGSPAWKTRKPGCRQPRAGEFVLAE